MTAFSITQRAARKQKEGTGYTRQCEAPGCIRSARFTARFLDSHDVHLCAQCRSEWALAWANASSNWGAV